MKRINKDNTMNNNKALTEKIDFYRNSLTYLEYLKNDIIYISSRKEDYFKEVVHNSSFFARVYRNSIKLFVVELFKILNNSKKEHYNIQFFLNDLIENFERYDWFTKPEVEEITKFRNRISVISKSDDFTKIKNLRNKYYAHSDSDRDKFKTNIPFEKLWIILEEIQQIFVYINLHLNREQFIFSLVNKGIAEIKSLQKHRKINHYVLSELRKSHNIGKLQEIRNIMLE